ncbi:Zn-ribbon domain-containing OB-fold protein [Natrialbaceae archaeon AArc-T1-2]|uniref:Zn-ribbon domain-containing OB-fold protein n=1 Tax=Natrialbaceae archaeon AArc-T1-2 TaxID=3053904 RepID=UPI00255B2BCD|nr:OB-fold domain-containing protein [Natrialbaceae archaeon AArc-T1-2]WIV68182.1 OB-fold domain-containing protein [Natrialbaceae archaeon AArc-T1-2]
MSETVRDEGFDDWLDAVERGEPYYLKCTEGHSFLPPRRVCPDCGSTSVESAPLPATGDVETFTVTSVATPAFEDDTPYAVAIADFGPVRLTGQLVEIDVDDVENGMTVEPDVVTSETTGERVLSFRPCHASWCC